MNVNILIDAIVRQTTVLIAQLATSGGGRPSLAHTANQIFFRLTKELKEQGVSSKVIADMFGVALRTYHSKVRRLEESATYGGRSLWDAVLGHLQERGTVSRADLLLRFKSDDPATVKSVLKDLVESGIAFKTGRGRRSSYRAVGADEVTAPSSGDPHVALANLVWVSVNRLGNARFEQLLELVPMDASSLRGALDALIADGRVLAEKRDDADVYSCDGCFISLEDPRGWEAALFDHYQAVVTAITKKLMLNGDSALADRVGGTTASLFVWDEHPLRAEVYGLLTDTRERVARLRERVAAYNHASGMPQSEMTRVIFYAGQTFLEPETRNNDDE